MPNHIRNELKFKGNCLKIKSLLECIADKEIGIGSIDFNKIIPMPDTIQNSNGDEWYWWSVENWGTKWNAYEQESLDDDDLELLNENENGTITIWFQTAWSAPHKVIEALAKFDPDIQISHYWADEDIGYNCGKALYVGGEVIEDCYYHGGIVGTEFACKIWGGTPADFHLGLNKDKTDYIYKEELDV